MTRIFAVLAALLACHAAAGVVLPTAGSYKLGASLGLMGDIGGQISLSTPDLIGPIGLRLAAEKTATGAAAELHLNFNLGEVAPRVQATLNAGPRVVLAQNQGISARAFGVGGAFELSYPLAERLFVTAAVGAGTHFHGEIDAAGRRVGPNDPEAANLRDALGLGGAHGVARIGVQQRF